MSWTIFVSSITNVFTMAFGDVAIIGAVLLGVCAFLAFKSRMDKMGLVHLGIMGTGVFFMLGIIPQEVFYGLMLVVGAWAGFSFIRAGGGA